MERPGRPDRQCGQHARIMALMNLIKLAAQPAGLASSPAGAAAPLFLARGRPASRWAHTSSSDPRYASRRMRCACTCMTSTSQVRSGHSAVPPGRQQHATDANPAGHAIPTTTGPQQTILLLPRSVLKILVFYDYLNRPIRSLSFYKNWNLLRTCLESTCFLRIQFLSLVSIN